MGRFLGRFLTKFLRNFVMANKKSVRVPKTVTWCNRPIPSFPRSLYQNEVKCLPFYMERIFYFLLLIISSSLLYITLRGTIFVYLDVPLSPLLPTYNVIQFKCCNFYFTRFFLCKSLPVTILLFSRYIYITMYQLGTGGINKLIFIRKVLHLASFWKWGVLEDGSGIFHTTLTSPDPVQRATAKWPIRCNNRVGQSKAPNDNQNCRGSIQVLTNLRPKHSTPFLDTSL